MSGYCPAIRQDCPYLTPTPEELVEMLGVAKASGLAEGIRRARGAVEKLLPDFLVGVDCSGGFNKPSHLVEVGAYKKGTILAAIDAVEGE